MKKIGKFFVSLGLLSLVSLPTISLVSCSENTYQGLIFAENKDLQKIMFQHLELDKSQFNFSYTLDPDDKTFWIDEILGETWNFYDPIYENGRPNDGNPYRNNVFLVPSKVMYNDEWYDFISVTNLDYGFKNDIMCQRLKSIRFDPTMKQERIALHLNFHMTNLVDIQNFPLSVREYKNGEWQWTGNGISNIRSNSLKITFRENIQTDDPEQLYALPYIETEQRSGRVLLKDFEIPSKVNVIRKYEFEDIEYSNFAFPNTIKYLEGQAFNLSFKASFIPQSFYKDKIPDYLFADMTIDINVPNVNTIGKWAFYRADFVNEKVYIPEGVRFIKYEAFNANNYEYGQNTKYYLPNSLEELEGFPFEDESNILVIVKSERVKNLLIEAVKTSKIYDFNPSTQIIVDPNYQNN